MSDHKTYLINQMAIWQAEEKRCGNKARELENEYVKHYAEFKVSDKIRLVEKETGVIRFGIIKPINRYKWPFYIKYEIQLTDKSFVPHKRRNRILISNKDYTIEKLT